MATVDAHNAVTSEMQCVIDQLTDGSYARLGRYVHPAEVYWLCSAAFTAAIDGFQVSTSRPKYTVGPNPQQLPPVRYIGT